MAKKLSEVRESAIHGRGLYATADIAAGAAIIQYLGEKITKAESNRRALEWEERARKSGDGLVYNFELDDEWDLDGLVGDNPARYINHSCDGNCEAINDDNEIWITARRAIKKGEELLYDYGYDMEHFLDHPCKCGSDNCIGYIRNCLSARKRNLLNRNLRKRINKKNRL